MELCEIWYLYTHTNIGFPSLYSSDSVYGLGQLVGRPGTRRPTRPAADGGSRIGVVCRQLVHGERLLYSASHTASAGRRLSSGICSQTAKAPPLVDRASSIYQRQVHSMVFTEHLSTSRYTIRLITIRRCPHHPSPSNSGIGRESEPVTVLVPLGSRHSQAPHHCSRSSVCFDLVQCCCIKLDGPSVGTIKPPGYM